MLALDLLIYGVSWLAFAVLSHRIAGSVGRAPAGPVSSRPGTGAPSSAISW